MLQKKPKTTATSFIKKSATIIIGLETGAFFAAYYFYHRLNTNKEFRFYCHNKFPWILDKYYTLGEYFGNNTARQLDQAAWAQEQKIE